MGHASACAQAVEEEATRRQLPLHFNGARDHADATLQEYKVCICPHGCVWHCWNSHIADAQAWLSKALAAVLDCLLALHCCWQ
jgi:G:T-mismatch repair DNA endonuclease (very short patch repair protein)